VFIISVSPTVVHATSTVTLSGMTPSTALQPNHKSLPHFPSHPAISVSFSSRLVQAPSFRCRIRCAPSTSPYRSALRIRLGGRWPVTRLHATPFSPRAAAAAHQPSSPSFALFPFAIPPLLPPHTLSPLQPRPHRHLARRCRSTPPHCSSPSSPLPQSRTLPQREFSPPQFSLFTALISWAHATAGLAARGTAGVFGRHGAESRPPPNWVS
jgi:hypothetical protein